MFYRKMFDGLLDPFRSLNRRSGCGLTKLLGFPSLVSSRMSLRSSIRDPTSATHSGPFLEDPEPPATEFGLPLPVGYPSQGVSSDTIRGIQVLLDAMDLHRGHFRSIHTHLQVVSSRMVMRIHFLIGAPFRLLTEALHCWNRLAGSPAIRPGLLAAVTTSVLIPVSCSLYFSRANYVASFTVLVVAIHSLVYFLNFIFDDLEIRYGDAIACLLHATTVVGLIRNEPQVVQASLLIPGLCFFFGGLRLSDQHFNRMIARSNLKSPMVILGFIAFILPSTLGPVHFVNEKPNVERRGTTPNYLVDRIPSCFSVSSVESVPMAYVGYTISQLLLGTRSDTEPRQADGPTSIPAGNRAANPPADAPVNLSSHTANSNSPDEDTSVESGASEEQCSGLETPKISATIAIIVLFGVSGLLVVTTVFLDDTLQRITENSLMSRWFFNSILSPLVTNLPVAVTASVNGKPYKDLTIAETLSMQMTLFTIPLVTIIAWGMDKSFGFSSDLFGFTVLALSGTYLVVATTSWFYPGPSNATVPNLLTNMDEARPCTGSNRVRSLRTSSTSTSYIIRRGFCSESRHGAEFRRVWCMRMIYFYGIVYSSRKEQLEGKRPTGMASMPDVAYL
ncbi:hypothetical protein EDB89DRAFT_2152892 [Lactarius sanguifluus]|nr:hypothetical protein EDB89DRAFT_2152892 [Lactarius sanguifluus]